MGDASFQNNILPSSSGEEFVVALVLATLVCKTVNLDRIVWPRVSTDCRVGTASACLVRRALNGTSCLMLAQVLSDALVILVLADPLLVAGDCVADTALDRSAQPRRLTASSRFAKLPAVLRRLLNIPRAVLSATVAKLAAAGPRAPVTPNTVDWTLLAEARANLCHVTDARKAARESSSELGRDTFVKVITVQNGGFAGVTRGASEIVRRLRSDSDSTLAVLDAILPTIGLARPPGAPGAEHAVPRAWPKPSACASSNTCGWERCRRGIAGADVAGNLVIVCASDTLSLEQGIVRAAAGVCLLKALPS